MRVLVFGAGAVGCFIGGHLALAHHDVTFLGRDWLKDAIDENGLVIQAADGTAKRVDSVTIITALDDVKAYDFILFSMKSYDTVRAIQQLVQHLMPPLEAGYFVDVPPPPPIVCFQNGVGNEASLESAFGADYVIAATLTSPVSMAEAGVVVEEKARGIAIAKDNPASKAIINAFDGTELEMMEIDSSASLKWSKLITNMVGNTIPAITDMPPDKVYSNRALFELERDAVLETVAILELADIEIVDLPGIPVRRLIQAFQSLPTLISQFILKSKIGKGRGDKLPSLQLALGNQKPVTEVEWLNGAVVKLADDLNRYTPVNHVLALVLADIAIGRVPWDAYRGNPDLLLTAVRSANRHPLQ